MTKLLLTLIFPTLSVLLWPLLGQAEYAYPYTDPYYASISVAILKADDRDPSPDAKPYTFKVEGRSDRNNVPAYEGRNRIPLRAWTQKQAAPLIVLMAGLGGNATSSYLNFIGYQLWKKGFHVLSIPSSLNWNFTLSFSQTGYPGIASEDAKEEYALIQEGIRFLKQKKNIQITKYGLIGFSMGALHAAYVHLLDTKNLQLFQKTLMVNPPVDIAFGIQALDNLQREGAGLSSQQIKNLNDRIMDFGWEKLGKSDIKDPAYFTQLETKLPLNLKERKFLIGSSLRSFLGPLIYTTQQVRNTGALQSNGRDNRLREASQWSFMDYIQKLLLPAYSELIGRTATEEDIRLSSFYGIEEELKRANNVYLYHNENDFIVNKEQLDYLEGILGPRMHRFPLGGHLGNIWYPQNLNLILSLFEDIK